MKLLLSLLLAIRAIAATITIDCGSATDQYFTGGLPYTVQPADDTTLRFSSSATAPFWYRIPIDNGVYAVTFSFLEPSAAPPARAFSITINDQLTYPRIMMQGFLQKFSRTAVVAVGEGMLTIRFDTIIRSAVVSSIEVKPLLPPASIVLPVDGLPFRVLSEIPAMQADGTWMLKGAMTGSSYLIYDVAVYVNGLRMTPGADYDLTPDSGPVFQLKILPTAPWTGRVLVDYTVYLPPSGPPPLPVGDQ